MKKVLCHVLAEKEVVDAVTYCDGQEVGLGLEYLEEVEHDAVTFLARYSEAGSKVQGSIRRFILPRFPYSPLYRVLDQDRIRT